MPNKILFDRQAMIVHAVDGEKRELPSMDLPPVVEFKILRVSNQVHLSREYVLELYKALGTWLEKQK